MNRKGFTLVELLATLAILGLIMGIVLFSVLGNFNKTKEKTEDIFVDTIKDAMDMYLSSNSARGLTFNDLVDENNHSCYLDKSYGEVKVYVATTNFSSVINSEYKPITQEDLVNPANKDTDCEDANNITINVYRDEDYVYYYSIDKGSFECLANNGVITNLPGEFVCK